MKQVIACLVLVLYSVTAYPGPTRLGPPAEERAESGFAKAAAEAEVAYRETVVGSLKALESRLADAERAAVRGSDIKEANRIRFYRSRLSRLADEVSEHVWLGGILPPIDRHFVPPSAKRLIVGTAGELSEADGVYTEALEGAREEAAGLLATGMERAVATADLDAANKVLGVRKRIEKDIEARLARLAYHEFRFSSLHHTKGVHLLETPEAWRVVDGELIGTERRGERLEFTVGASYDRISAVTIRGRTRRPSNTNFRISVGPVNVIFNWEIRPACIYRYQENGKTISGNLLVTDREHEITVRQLTGKSIEVLVDGQRKWMAIGRLHGTITVYPSESTIGVREIRVLGVQREGERPERPSHRRW